MEKKLLFIYCFAISYCSIADKLKYPDGFEPQKQNISFTENIGQVSDQYYKSRLDILFSGTTDGMTFHLRNNGISYQLYRVDSWKEIEGIKKTEKIEVIDQSTIYRLDVNWLNCNSSAKITKENALPEYNNYYSEVCPYGVNNVKSYNKITYQNIYSGIDFK